LLSLQPISAFAISEFDPNLEDQTVVQIEADVLEVDAHWLWVVVITPYQPGVNVVFADTDVTVEISWVQLEVPS